jgi:hypothetical protein
MQACSILVCLQQKHLLLAHEEVECPGRVDGEQPVQTQRDRGQKVSDSEAVRKVTDSHFNEAGAKPGGERSILTGCRKIVATPCGFFDRLPSVLAAYSPRPAVGRVALSALASLKYNLCSEDPHKAHPRHRLGLFQSRAHFQSLHVDHERDF